MALVVCASNSSLCGAFNSNVARLLEKTLAEYHSLGKENIVIYAVGKKAEEAVKRTGCSYKGTMQQLVDKPAYVDAYKLAEELMMSFADEKVDRVELIYHHFKSAGSQILTRKKFLPIDVQSELDFDDERDLSSNIATLEAQEYLRKKGHKTVTEKEEAKPLNDNFIVEPDMNTVLAQLIPKLLHLMIYTALLDSNASEHAARMVAMQTATDNADELLRELNLQYNKSRQQAITNELLDIVGGSVNN